MQYAKTIITASVAIGGIAVLCNSYFGNSGGTNVNRVETAQRRALEAQNELHKAISDESRSLWDECFNQATSESGIYFDEQQKQAYECWKEGKTKITKTNGTGKLTPSSEPPSSSIISSNISKNGMSKSTIGGDTKESSSRTNQVVGVKKINSSTMEKVQNTNSRIIASGNSNNNGGKSEQGKTKNVCPKKVILRNGWNDPRVQHAYNISCGDMDFIKTIEAESRWDVGAVGDKGHAFGLCQINKLYNPSMQKAYKELKNDKQKVEFCYAQYSEWKKRGVIQTRLYGYNVRNKPTNVRPFSFM